MMGSMSPDELKETVSRGLLAFPLTDFNASNEFDPRAHAARIEWLSGQGAAAFFSAGGAGEFFSLSKAEYLEVIHTAVTASGSALPIIASAGYGTRLAIEYVQEAERLGVDGILLLPPYLTEATQEGLRDHITAVCRSTRLGVIVYNRANCQPNAETLDRIAETCPNFVGFKDGVGNMETLLSVRSRLNGRLAMINGMPTAEVYARSYRTIGIPAYSSAVFNFAPRSATAFYGAVLGDDLETYDAFVTNFLLPYLKIRGRQPGYAVSIVKAGAEIVGRSAGKVRPPLSDLTPHEYEELSSLIARLGPQE